MPKFQTAVGTLAENVIRGVPRLGGDPNHELSIVRMPPKPSGDVRGRFSRTADESPASARR